MEQPSSSLYKVIMNSSSKVMHRHSCAHVLWSVLCTFSTYSIVQYYSNQKGSKESAKQACGKQKMQSGNEGDKNAQSTSESNKKVQKKNIKRKVLKK